MRKVSVSLAVLAFLLLVTVSLCAQQPPQDKSKRASPPGTASVTFKDGKKITVDYSRPKIRDPKTGQPRKIMGGLVPYGQEWRTGANEATTFVTDTNVKVGDLSVPAGNYTLYTIPGENEWTIIINKQTGQWGTVYQEAQDLGRTKVKSGKTGQTVQEFTISFTPAKDKKTTMNLKWENTKVSVPITEE